MLYVLSCSLWWMTAATWRGPCGQELLTLAHSQQGWQAGTSQVSLLRSGSSPSQTLRWTLRWWPPLVIPWFNLCKTSAHRTQLSHRNREIINVCCLKPLSLEVICYTTTANTLPCTSDVLSTATLPRTLFTDPWVKIPDICTTTSLSEPVEGADNSPPHSLPTLQAATSSQSEWATKTKPFVIRSWLHEKSAITCHLMGPTISFLCP